MKRFTGPQGILGNTGMHQDGHSVLRTKASKQSEITKEKLMLQKHLIIACTLGALLIPSLAHAGSKSSDPVRVVKHSGGGGYFSGSFASARNSSNRTEYISCNFSSSGYAGCQARNSAGTHLSCSATNNAVKDAIRDVGEHAYLSVRVDSSSRCSYVYTNNSSINASK